MENLKKIYLENVVPLLINEFEYKNIYQVPFLKKIVINRGFSESCQIPKVLDSLLTDLTFISGQKVLLSRSRFSIANFKVKENMPVGMFVTLRGNKMYSFLDRLVNLSLPRVREFSGLSKVSFDSFGNYSIGLSEQIMFPEVEFEKLVKLKGMDIVIVTSAKSKEEAFFLLSHLGVPFREFV